MSCVVHDVRYRPPRRRTARMRVLIRAHNKGELITRRFLGVAVMWIVGDTDLKGQCAEFGWLHGKRGTTT